MKELSIEEKAKAYDGLIERLKDLKFAYRFSPLSDTIEEKFPELKESEDERIRKSLIILLQHFCNGYRVPGLNFLVSYKDMLAWLEKQCEHANFRNKIQIGDKVTRNEDGVLVNFSQLNRVAKKDEKQSEQKPADEVGNYDHKEVLQTIINEQNSAWSEEDEKMAESCENAIVFELTDNAKDDELKTDPRLKWLKSLKDRVQPQLKQEWSEEDDEMLNSVIEEVRYIGDFPDYPTKEENELYDECLAKVEWLKHLKERVQSQNTWKPSDEQMEMLENVRKILHTNDIYSKANHLMYNFEELIRTIKKLREE